MHWLLAGSLLNGLVTAWMPTPPGGIDGNPWFGPGKRVQCGKWFPDDPCFYKDTFHTQCYQAYDWKHLRYPDESAHHTNLMLGGTGLADVSSIEDGSIDMTLSEDWSLHNLSTDYEMTSGVPDKRGDNSATHRRALPDRRPNPPCCQWTQACWNYLMSKGKYYNFDGDNNEEEYYKYVCCIVSWAAKCGGSVPHSPKLINPPPKCTMPEGYERENAWELPPRN